MERAREWKAGREGLEVKAGASVEAMTSERSGSAAARWRSAAASSPGADSAGSTGAGGAGGGMVATARGLAADGVLTILRERKEILAVAVAAAEGRGGAADLVLAIALGGGGRRRGPWMSVEESGWLCSVLALAAHQNVGLCIGKLWASMSPIIVSELIDSSSAVWRVDKLQQNFLPSDVMAIRNMPLCTIPMAGFWAWQFEKKGEFSVRSAYHMLVSIRNNREDLLGQRGSGSNAAAEEKCWTSLWNTQVPVKSKLFFGG